MAASAAGTELNHGGPQMPVPPEERFWKRYSAHGEAPLSVAGSFALHLLGAGGLLLFALFVASHLLGPPAPLPVDTVRILPGGTGSRDMAREDGKGAGVGAEVVEKGDAAEKSQPGLLDAPPRVDLTPVEKTRIEQSFDREAARYISDRSTEMSKAFAGLDDKVRRKLADGLTPGKGQGGTGTGKGKGPGPGDGKAKLTKREKLMIRMHMEYPSNSGAEYLAQLRGLGGILAFPIKEGEATVYKVVRDLRPGGRLLDEDISKIRRIYWVDNTPAGVRVVLDAMGLRLPQLPGHFVTFLPEKLEHQLAAMERSYVRNVLRKPFDEDAIERTQFKVVRGPSGYKVELLYVKLRP